MHAPEPQARFMLQVYGGTIQNVKEMSPCFADTPLEELKERYERDGVVWVKGLLDRDMVLGCRKNYLSFVNEGTGMLKNGTDPVDGIFSGADWKEFVLPGAVRVAAGLKDEGLFVEHAIKSHSAALYQDFKSEVAKTLEPFTQQLCGFEDSWCLPRSLLRCAMPGCDSTPVHHGQIFLRGGPPTSITAWVPIGDVEIAGGGRIYLEGSHKLGVDLGRKLSEQNAGLTKEERISAFNKNMMAGGWLSRNAGEYGAERKLNWLVGAYEAGDVVFHNPHMIHAGAKNESNED